MSKSLTDELKTRLKPTPMSELSWPRRLRRGFGFMLFLSSLAMGVSAATASSDWELQADGTKAPHDDSSDEKSSDKSDSKSDAKG